MSEASRDGRDPTPRDLLDHVVRFVAGALGGIEHATLDLSIGCRGGPAADQVVWAGPVTRAGVVHDYQQNLGDGPTLRAVRTRSVISMDLAELDSAWPELGGAAAAVGVGSVLAVPLPPASSTGCLTLYRTTAGPVDPVVQTALGLLGDALARAITAQRVAATVSRLTVQFTDALRSRAPIEQAKGILMAAHHVDADAAFALLRRESQTTNVRLTDVATAFVARHSTPAGGAHPMTRPPAAVNPTDRRGRSADFRDAVDRAPLGMAITGLDGQLQYVNRALARLLTCDPADLVGTTLIQHTHPDDHPATHAAITAVREGTIPESQVPARLLTAHGAEVPVTITTAVVLDRHGQEPHLILHFKDAPEPSCRAVSGDGRRHP